MIQLTKGERFNLSKEAPALTQVVIGLGWSVSQTGQSFDVDASVFMLGSDQKIPDEKYFVFYNNRESPDGAVSHSGDNQTGQGEGDDESITIDLSRVNPGIETLLFVVTIHEGQEKGQNFQQIQDAFIRLYNPESKIELARYNLRENFSQETAVEFGRLYRKNGEWRFQAVGQGYQQGLQSFVDQYYPETRSIPTTPVIPAPPPPAPVIPPPPPAPVVAPPPARFDLEKKLKEKAPRLFDLSKKAQISLEKANLSHHQAKVALCLDVSGSMYDLYRSGKVQQLAEKVLALGCRFDDDGAIDIFLFAGQAQNMGEMNLDNFQNFIGKKVQEKYRGAGGTKYAPAMQMIREFYFGESSSPQQPQKRSGWWGKNSKNSEKTSVQTVIQPVTEPVYVMFVTDGDAFDQIVAETALKQSSYQPIFWQFMGVGAGKFKFLERLDQISDRYLDNADFFSVADPEGIPDDQLYDLLMAEYPRWVQEAQAKQLLV